jgi:alkylated DNA repair dioxygenase AlkB
VVPHQRSLLVFGEPGVSPDAGFTRVPLDERSWVDVARNWLRGADDVLDVLMGEVDWHQGRRRMWERVVDDPRLSHWYRDGQELPHPCFHAVRAALEARYRVELSTVGLNYYRDGNDSVAPHADRELRDLDETIVAIVTFGSRRPFLLRPKTAEHGRLRRSLDLCPASGDLLVMGGACQAGWEHAVPKVTRAGPRISATWRWARRTERAAG